MLLWVKLTSQLDTLNNFIDEELINKASKKHIKEFLSHSGSADVQDLIEQPLRLLWDTTTDDYNLLWFSNDLTPLQSKRTDNKII